MVHKAAEFHVPEPGRGGHLPQHFRDLVGHQHPHVDGTALPSGEIGRCRLSQGHRGPLAGTGDNAAEIHEGQLRQYQIIHLVERVPVQGQIPPPVQIVQEIRHNILPSSILEVPIFYPVSLPVTSKKMF